MVLLEAMSFGKATVISDVPGSGMGWIVDHGVTGLKVRPSDADALADAFRELIANPNRVREMGRAGRKKYQKEFDINHAVEGIVQTYHSVLGNGAWTGSEKSELD
jgi:rhamnosyl/mannosyltransferase